MPIYIPHALTLFCVLFVIMVITSIVMGNLSRSFYTVDVVRRKFSIIDLELPASAKEIANVIKGIYKLKDKECGTVIKALRKQLYVDFIFMPAAYGSIFILCMQLSWKLSSGEAEFFIILAYLQSVAWICDIVENIFLLNQIRPDIRPCGKGVFTAYRVLEAMKWGFSLLGAVCGLSSALFLWLSGHWLT
jgi:hypothetical protein